MFLLSASYHITFSEGQLLPAVGSSLQDKRELQKSWAVVWNRLAMLEGAACPKGTGELPASVLGLCLTSLYYY